MPNSYNWNSINRNPNYNFDNSMTLGNYGINNNSETDYNNNQGFDNSIFNQPSSPFEQALNRGYGPFSQNNWNNNTNQPITLSPNPNYTLNNETINETQTTPQEETEPNALPEDFENLIEPTAEEASLLEEIGWTGGVTIATTSVIPNLRHPINTIKSILPTIKEVDAIKGFRNLDPVKRMEVFKQILKNKKAEILINKIARGAGENEKIIAELRRVQSLYIDAIKKNNIEVAQKCVTDLNTITKKCAKRLRGKIPFYFDKPVETLDELKKGKDTAKASKTVLKTTDITKEAIKKYPQPKMGWFKNALKTGGAAVMGAIEGAVELINEVYPAFSEVGAEEGFKQLGKSTAKVAASVGGWCVGAKIGAAIGTTIFPGAGTLVGAAVGALGSIVCSWVCRKCVDAVAGESYSQKKAKIEKANQGEIIKDKQTNPQEINENTNPTEHQSTTTESQNTQPTSDNNKTTQNTKTPQEMDALIQKHLNGTATQEELAFLDQRWKEISAKFDSVYSPMFGMPAFGHNPYNYC